MGTEKIICSRYFVRRLQLGKRVRIDDFLSFFLKYFSVAFMLAIILLRDAHI